MLCTSGDDRASTSQTIVRKVRDGSSDPGSDRFQTETKRSIRRRNFSFTPMGGEMTIGEVCDALVAYGISEADALTLIDAAVVSFDHA
jgi:hypothetical protein